MTFEETAEGDDGFKAPSFEDKGGLSEKELEELEKELDETLGDFDEEIEREQEYAEGRANEDGSEGGSGAFDNEGAFDEYDETEDGVAKGGRKPSTSGDQQGQQGETAASSDSDSAGGESGETSNPRDGQSKNQQQPDEDPNKDDGPDVEDLRKNDDIVARQIREAAENETDPELKKKLWEEYYNYKKQ